MTKADIVEMIAKNGGIEKKVALEVVDSFMESIREPLISGENVYPRGFIIKSCE